MPKLFPNGKGENSVIYITGVGATERFSALLVNSIMDFKFQNNGQGFPRFYYEMDNGKLVRRDAISSQMLQKFKTVYRDSAISSDDLFFYIYGIFHSFQYVNDYKNDLRKMLPRIPFAKDFWGFSKTGRKLADIHLNYETIKPFNLKEEISNGAPKKEKELYRVTEAGMKFPKVDKKEDRTTIIYNGYVTLKGIPLEAYDYVVNGKSAIEWVMERYAITVDLNSKGEGSGIKNDPNEWSDDPRYIVDLVKRVVQVSLETNKLIASLPPLEIITES